MTTRIGDTQGAPTTSQPIHGGVGAQERWGTRIQQAHRVVFLSGP
jgi:hypothetical protein